MPINAQGSELPAVRPLPPAPVQRKRVSKEASLREVMSRFATGVTVITAGGEDGHGMTANAFTSVSLDPPLVLCCVSRAARMHEVITSAACFAISILGAEQRELARYFSDRRRPRGRAQFESVDCYPGACTGAPLLTEALAWLECALVRVYDGGDHSIFVGKVLSSTFGQDYQPLLFFGGSFQQIVEKAA